MSGDKTENDVYLIQLQINLMRRVLRHLVEEGTHDMSMLDRAESLSRGKLEIDRRDPSRSPRR